MKKLYLFLITALISCSVYSQKNENVKEIPKHKSAVKKIYNITVPGSAEKVYNFIINDFSRIYRETSDAHDYFIIRGGGAMKPGCIIDCAEAVKNQSIVHEYVVEEMKKNKSIYYYSKPSRSIAKVGKKEIEGESNVYVYWLLEEINGSETKVTFTVITQFNSSFEKFMINSVLGKYRPWKKHFIEEMEGFKSVYTKKI